MRHGWSAHSSRASGRQLARFRLVLLTITTSHAPATDLGFLLHKNPARAQSFDLGFGRVQVFHPEASPERCTAALLLDVDSVGPVRGKGGPDGEDGVYWSWVSSKSGQS